MISDSENSSPRRFLLTQQEKQRVNAQTLSDDGYEELCLNATKRVVNNKINEQREYSRVFNLTKSHKKHKDPECSDLDDSILTPASLRMKMKELDFSPTN